VFRVRSCHLLFFSIRDTVSHGAAAFFGVPPVSITHDYSDFEQEQRRDNKWTARRMRHASRRYGGVRDVPLEQRSATIDSEFCFLLLTFML
jgi:hypothetical protein